MTKYEKALQIKSRGEFVGMMLGLLDKKVATEWVQSYGLIHWARNMDAYMKGRMSNG